MLKWCSSGCHILKEVILSATVPCGLIFLLTKPRICVFNCFCKIDWSICPLSPPHRCEFVLNNNLSLSQTFMSTGVQGNFTLNYRVDNCIEFGSVRGLCNRIWECSSSSPERYIYMTFFYRWYVFYMVTCMNNSIWRS